VQSEEREASQEETLPSHGVARWLARLGQTKPNETAPAPPPQMAPLIPEEPAVAEADPLPAEVPDQIPPSPEPEALTAQAVRESFPLEDPRAIDLPAHGVSLPQPLRSDPASNPRWAAAPAAL